MRRGAPDPARRALWLGGLAMGPGHGRGGPGQGVRRSQAAAAHMRTREYGSRVEIASAQF